PDVGGVGGQAMCYISVPDSNSIKIIGNRYDTILPGPNDKPWLGEFDYSGDNLNVVALVDSQYTTPFNVFNNPLAHKKGNIYYYYAKRDIGETYYIPYLMELNIKSGKILRSKLIINEQYPDLGYSGNYIKYNYDNSILLVNSLHKADSVKTFITILDTFFNIKKNIEIKDKYRKNYAYFGRINSDETYTIIGYTLVEDGIHPNYSQIFYNKVDSIGNILKYKLAPTTIPIELGIAYTRTVTEDEFGHWIISGLQYEDRSSICFNCYQLIPYIFSCTSEFGTLLWQTRFYDVPNNNFPQYFLHSMTHAEGGYVAAGDYVSGSSFPQSGVLFKAALNGDSLWMKHYVPLNWENNRVAWANFNDIQTTPYGTIIVVGAIGDNEEQKVRPWILQLDSDGCLVPGCNTVSTHEENITASKKDYFKIYPNPVSDELYLLSTITSNDPVNISLVSNDGKVLKVRNFNPSAGYQYILPVSDLVPGSYYLVITNPKTNQSESHSFIRL
ncbi:MAG: T9SS type A sorting domain-containing protein, partial [Saprospiraceae bacterium]